MAPIACLQHLRIAVERLVQELQDRAVRDVELVLRGADPDSRARGRRVGGSAASGLTPSQSTEITWPVGPDAAVSPRAVAATELELLEAEVVADFVVLGMEHLPLSVPDLGTPRAFALDDDLVQRGECGCEVVDHGDAARVAGEARRTPAAAGSPQKTFASPRRAERSRRPCSIAS